MGGGVGMRNMVNQRKWILIAEDIGMGAAVFSITQLLIRIPILQNVLAYQPWFQVLPYASPFLYGLFLAATAGLAEEPGRYLGFLLLGKSTGTGGMALLLAWATEGQRPCGSLLCWQNRSRQALRYRHLELLWQFWKEFRQ